MEIQIRKDAPKKFLMTANGIIRGMLHLENCMKNNLGLTSDIYLYDLSQFRQSFAISSPFYHKIEDGKDLGFKTFNRYMEKGEIINEKRESFQQRHF